MKAESGIAPLKLTDEEQAMLAGEMGEPKRWAIDHMMKVGRMFDAADFVPVAQAHTCISTRKVSVTPGLSLIHI